MNKAQAEKVIGIIENDATGTGVLLDGGGTMCVIGGLLHAARVPKQYLLGVKGPSLSDKELLWRRYGLGVGEVYDLIDINDDHNTIPARRRALIKYVKSLVTK